MYGFTFCHYNCIGDIMVNMFDSSAGDRECELRSGQPKDYIVGMWCSSAKHAALRTNSKDWLARNQINASE